MTETFDFVEACVQMKAGDIFEIVGNTMTTYLRINDDLGMQVSYCDGKDWGYCGFGIGNLSRKRFRKHIPTVSGKEAICAFIDDPSLIVRCVDWAEGMALGYDCEELTVIQIGKLNDLNAYPLQREDLQNGKWTIEKGDE